MAGDDPKPVPAAVSASVHAFRCPSCGATVELRAVGQSLVVVCSACHAIIDAADENHRILTRARKLGDVKLAIPLGRRGTLRGEIFEVIGYLRRSNWSGAYLWDEYLLWSPKRGFRWLLRHNGHWSFITPIKGQPTRSHQCAVYDGVTYQLFDKGRARVLVVLGEFYWRVKEGDTVHTADYVRPPMMLSEERDGDEVVWSVGEYVQPEEIRQAFMLDVPMAVPIGVAPNQPGPLVDAWPQIIKRTVAFVAALFIIQMVAPSDGRTIAKQSFFFQGDTKEDAPLVSQSFDIAGNAGNVVIDLDILDTYFNNHWADFDVTLVEETSAVARAVGTEISFYEGTDSDGPWAEGSKHGQVVVTDVPAGRYHLEIEPVLDGLLKGMNFTATVRRGVVGWINFVLALAAVLMFCAVAWWRQHIFEVQRWSDSDYSPYSTGEE